MSSSGSPRSRKPSPPTVSIENVELLEADRQHEKKRQHRHQEVEEAGKPEEAAAGGAAAAATTTTATPAPTPSSAPNAPAFDLAPPPQQQQPPQPPPPHQQQQQQQQPPHPQHPQAYYYPYQQMPYGMPPPYYGYPPGHFPQMGAPGAGMPPQGQHAPPQQPPPYNYPDYSMYDPNAAAAAAANAPTGYGSLSHTAPSNSSSAPLTIDDIENSFNRVLASQSMDDSNNHSTSKSTIPPAPASTSETAPLLRPPTKETVDKQPVSSGSRSHRRATSDASPPSSPAPRVSGNGSTASRGSAKAHRRSGSTGNLPPAGPSRSSSPAAGLRKGSPGTANSPGGNRQRSFSGGGVPQRRLSRNMSASDLASVGAGSVASVGSMVSIVSDISKSALFQGVTDGGHVQMHFPYEKVRLVMDKHLDPGKLYMQNINPQDYENYHLAAEEITMWDRDPHHQGNKKDLMPPTFYVLPIKDDVYRRIMDEIAASRELPCGLFFCGHHEDVSHPSICIPITIVIILFLVMAYIAFWMHA